MSAWRDRRLAVVGDADRRGARLLGEPRGRDGLVRAAGVRDGQHRDILARSAMPMIACTCEIDHRFRIRCRCAAGDSWRPRRSVPRCRCRRPRRASRQDRLAPPCRSASVSSTFSVSCMACMPAVEDFRRGRADVVVAGKILVDELHGLDQIARQRNLELLKTARADLLAEADDAAFAGPGSVRRLPSPTCARRRPHDSGHSRRCAARSAARRGRMACSRSRTPPGTAVRTSSTTRTAARASRRACRRVSRAMAQPPASASSTCGAGEVLPRHPVVDVDETHAGPQRAASVGLDIVADHHRVGSFRPEQGQGFPEHRRLRLADHPIGDLAGAGENRGQQGAGLRHDGAVLARMRAVGIGDDQFGAFAHGVGGGGNSCEIELTVAAEHDDIARRFRPARRRSCARRCAAPCLPSSMTRAPGISRATRSTAVAPASTIRSGGDMQIHGAQRARQLFGHVLGVVGEQHETPVEAVEQRCSERKRCAAADQGPVKIDEIRTR